MFWSTRKTVELSLRFENVCVHPTAEIGNDVEIGPFSCIGPGCRVADGCRLHNNVTLVANTILGEDNEVFPGAVLGAIPQDKKYEGEDSWVVIGKDNCIRECVTIHGGTTMGRGVTRLGDRNLIMACCHVAHDCILEDDITLANNVLLGGHVRVGSHATFGGLVAVHHFVSVGRYAFIGGMSRIGQDVPPFMLVEGNPPKVWCVNKVGLRRKGFSAETIAVMKEAHRIIFRSQLPRSEAYRQVKELYGERKEIEILVDFLIGTEKGSLGRARQPRHWEDSAFRAVADER